MAEFQRVRANYTAQPGESDHEFSAPSGWYPVFGYIAGFPAGGATDADKVSIFYQAAGYDNWRNAGLWYVRFNNNSTSPVDVILEFFVSDQQLPFVPYGGQ